MGSVGVTSGSFSQITDAALEDLRQRVGVPITPPAAHITEATADSIRHWATGIGDDNPLWLDRAYAQQTRWGDIIAPGTFLYAFDRVVSGYVGGLPGVHAMFAGTDWRWQAPIRLGDTMTVTSSLKAAVDMESRFSGRAIRQVYEIWFHNQHGELVCTADSWCIRTQRDEARRRATRRDDTPTVWSPEEIAEIAEAYAQERPRGATPRYWSDVTEGEELPTVLKGPSTVTGFVCFTQGWGSLYVKAHRQAFEMFSQHPALAIPNRQGTPEPPERVHWDDDLARAVGVPAAYDYGPERVSWLGHLMTDWIGDDGFLKRLNVQVRRHNIVGDLTSCSGTVERRWVEGEEHLVEVAVRATNQRGDVTAVGTAVAALPER